MKRLRENIILRLLWVVLAVHILNIGIDAPDLYSFQQKENLAYNDIESIVELVLEDYLDFNNAIAEHDDSDEGGGLKFEKKIEFYCESIVFHCFTPTLFADSVLIPNTDSWLSNGALDELFQPPELA